MHIPWTHPETGTTGVRYDNRTVEKRSRERQREIVNCMVKYLSEKLVSTWDRRLRTNMIAYDL